MITVGGRWFDPIEDREGRKNCGILPSAGEATSALHEGRDMFGDIHGSPQWASPAPHQSKNKIKKKRKSMTDITNDDLELFDEAKEEFPGKEDLKDRLVAIWVTGRHGTRVGTAPGSKPYAWYETVTLVLDDGPNWTGMKIVDGEQHEMLVPSVAAEGPQRLDGFQYSQGGLTKRLEQRVKLTVALPPVGKEVKDEPKSFKPMLGRVNSRKNSQPGFSASWSIGKPTDADKEIAVKHADSIRAISAELEKAASAIDEDADSDFE